jgi:hypothetical protein
VGITPPLHSHLFRHQMLTFLTAKELSDARIRLISRHETKKSLEVYQPPFIGVGRKRLSERGSVGLGLTWVPHFCESFGTFVGI